MVILSRRKEKRGKAASQNPSMEGSENN